MNTWVANENINTTICAYGQCCKLESKRLRLMNPDERAQEIQKELDFDKEHTPCELELWSRGKDGFMVYLMQNGGINRIENMAKLYYDRKLFIFAKSHLANAAYVAILLNNSKSGNKEFKIEFTRFVHSLIKQWNNDNHRIFKEYYLIIFYLLIHLGCAIYTLIVVTIPYYTDCN